ncbi:cardiolipin synthase [Canibacter zhoujuaniae]|uniref:cardiolipin synthase n=1 Tax=Canibacter zhoujuaniae TaxID=2708343 RepID=UPI00141E7BE5|nr:cardiolipin synthase [Canibacter zhoujuaniae]
MRLLLQLLEQLPLFVVVIDTIIRILALFIVPRNRRPSSGTAWLLFIFALPIPGALLFAVIGSRRLPAIRRARHDFIHEKLQAAITDAAVASFPLPPEPRSEGLENAVRIGRALGAFPMLGGNKASLHYDYKESIQQMADAIDLAQSHVNVEFYILVSDSTTEPVFSALRRATARGVKVRVLIDHVAAIMNPGMLRTRRQLHEIGAELYYMLPLRPWRLQYQRPDLRNHRKLLTVDGCIGFMGSQNLIDSSYNKLKNRWRGLHWKDLMVRVEGPTVLALDMMFLKDWYAESGELLDFATDEFPVVHQESRLETQLLPSGPGYATENNLQVFVALLYTARRRISITSPYFVPDGALMAAIKAATARGVEVELFVSEIGDQPVVYHAQRSYYEELLEANVRIFMFRPPFILHAKHFTVDDDVAVIGSSNMDQRSFNLNFEISLVVHGADFVTELDGVNDYYREHSRELTLEEWNKRNIFAQLADNVARLTSSLQ